MNKDFSLSFNFCKIKNLPWTQANNKTWYVLSASIFQCVKLTSSSDQCVCSLFMHNACFDLFEESVLQYLKLSGRARSWSEKQRRQNIWSKRGYDLAYKACLCKCKKGYLKKDLDQVDEFEAPVSKSKKKKRRSNEKPLLILSTSPTNRNRTMSGNKITFWNSDYYIMNIFIGGEAIANTLCA